MTELADVRMQSDAQILALEGRNAELEAVRDKADAKITTLSAELSTARDELLTITDRAQERDASQAELERMQEIGDAAAQDIRALAEQKVRLEAEIAELRRRERSSQEHGVDAMRRLEDATSELAEVRARSDTEIRALEDRISGLARMRDALAATAEQKEQLEAENVMLRECAEDHHVVLAGVRESADAKSAEIASLTSELSTLRYQKIQTADRIHGLERERDDLKLRAEDLASQLALMTRRVDVDAEQHAAQDSLACEMETMRLEHAFEINTLNSKLEAAKEEIGALEAAAAQRLLDQELDTARTADLEARRDLAESQAANTRNEAALIAEEARDLMNQEQSVAEEAALIYARQTEALTSQLDGVRSDLAAEKKRADEVLALSKTAHARVTVCESELAKLDSERKKLEAELGETTRRLVDRETLQQGMQRRLEELQNINVNSSQDHAQKLVVLEAELAAAQLTIQQLELLRDDLKQIADGHAVEVRNGRQILADLAAAKSRAQAAEDRNAEVAVVLAELNEIRKALKTKESDLEQLQATAHKEQRRLNERIEEADERARGEIEEWKQNFEKAVEARKASEKKQSELETMLAAAG
ncbi:hypothetical protein BDK51DRAFT_33437, partial [Blyttiomyces helicus]